MSYKKERRPVLFRAGQNNSTLNHKSTGAWEAVHIQALTGASTGTAVTNYGITFITSTGNGSAGANVYTLTAPVKGIKKRIVGYVSSTKEITVRTATSAATFYGSTKNSFTFTTGSTYLPSAVDLVGYTSAQWAVLGISTPLVASTAVNDHQVTIAGATA